MFWIRGELVRYFGFLPKFDNDNNKQTRDDFDQDLGKRLFFHFNFVVIYACLRIEVYKIFQEMEWFSRSADHF